jgi:hypothetical protein
LPCEVLDGADFERVAGLINLDEVVTVSGLFPSRLDEGYVEGVGIGPVEVTSGLDRPAGVDRDGSLHGDEGISGVDGQKCGLFAVRGGGTHALAGYAEVGAGSPQNLIEAVRLKCLCGQVLDRARTQFSIRASGRPSTERMRVKWQTSTSRLSCRASVTSAGGLSHEKDVTTVVGA